MTMTKFKPEVKNELILEDALFLDKNDKSLSLRAVMLNYFYDDMIEMRVHKPLTEDLQEISIFITREQMEALIVLYNEWKELPEDVVST